MGEVRARLSDEGYRGWDRTVTREGVTLTALVESIGRELDAGSWHPPRRMIDEARKIDRERRSR